MAIRPDYTIGTITLTSGSSNFTTSGSSLQSGGVQAGDSIITRSGDVLIIATITGQNAGTLFQPCPASAAGAAQPLRIRFQPDGSRYQAAARDLIARWGQSGNVDAISGLASAANTMPYFTGVGTMGLTSLTPYGRTLISQNAGGQVYGTLGVIPNGALPGRLKEAALTAANADDANNNGWYIVSGTSPNAPPIGISYIQVFQHTPTVMTQIAYARDNFRMARRFMIGGVWGGWQELTPVRGSNANGEFVRFADGTQICWDNRSGIPLSGSTAVEFVLPASFANGLYSVAATVVSANPSSFHPITIIGLGLNSMTLAVEGAAGVGSANVRWSATGRWF